MDSPLIGVLIVLVMPVLMASVATQKLKPEDFKNPGGWKFPKAEVVGLGAIVGGLALGLVCIVVIAG